MDQDQIMQFLEEYLNNLQNFGMAEESTQLIRDNTKVIQVKSKDTLILPGDICKNVYLVVHGGFVCRYIHEKTGKANTINFYLENLHPVMACVDSFFTDVPTHCELKAIADSIVLALPKSVAEALKEQDKSYAKFYYDVIITAMVEENELKMKLIAYSSKEKYDYIMDEMPMVFQAVPSKYIAEFCGISPEWLSKLKKQSAQQIS